MVTTKKKSERVTYENSNTFHAEREYSTTYRESKLLQMRARISGLHQKFSRNNVDLYYSATWAAGDSPGC
jgi:hypothetical protein